MSGGGERVSGGVEALLAQLLLDEEFRRAFFVDPLTAARPFGVDDETAQRLATIDVDALEAQSRSLAKKRGAL